MSRQATRKRAPARRGNQRKSSGAPGWVWLFTGLVVGAFIASLVWLAKQPDTQLPSAGELADNIKQAAPDGKQLSKPIFEFYTRLSESEEIVESVDEPTTTTIESTPAQENEPPTSYLLQAASFRNYKDADALKAKLILMGMDVKVETVGSHGDTWHRVIVGPFTSTARLSDARSILAENNIQPLVMKQK
ncbi:MAG: SPOR domain-containing protein [Pseudomonadales bacterium]|nr:SPOR domain-containing protein [Pseudomonadales bacterium]